MIIVHDQHIIIHVISTKIGAAGRKVPIFAKILEGTYPFGLGQRRGAPVYGASTLNTI